jgi:hypothetical protein
MNAFLLEPCAATVPPDRSRRNKFPGWLNLHLPKQERYAVRVATLRKEQGVSMRGVGYSDPVHNQAVLRQGCTYQAWSSAVKLESQNGALHYCELWQAARDFLWV